MLLHEKPCLNPLIILSFALTLNAGLVTKRMWIEIPPPAQCCVLEQDILSSVLSAQQDIFILSA